MSSYPNLEVLNLIKELVFKLTNFQEGSNLFNHVENYVINCVHNADSMVFLKKMDIDRAIASLSDKFIFHGFSGQANDLARHYENFLPNSTPKDQCESKLNTLKFLLCLAESPTTKFIENSERVPVRHYEEEIDWPTYLNEGIERWSPPPAESSDDWSEISGSDISLNADPEVPAKLSKIIERDEIDNDCNFNYDVLKDSLESSIQNNWFLKDHVCMLPESSNIDANIALYWDDFLEHSVQGLISIKRSNIITEYCVLREIIWQSYVVHNSFIFHFVGDRLLPKENATISSIRPMGFQTFIHEFLPYIELLQEFKTFHESLSDGVYVCAPDTYRSYNNGLRNFLKPVFNKLVEIEREILTQKSTMTLLKLANEFRTLFKTADILKRIHQNVVLDFKTNDPIICATTLLSRLHLGLVHTPSKTELDIYLTLYLESLFKYFTIINLWIGNDSLVDTHDEFIIKQVNANPNVSMDVTDVTFTSVFTENIIDYDHFNMGFVVRELSEICRDDSIFKIIHTDVLQIGRNIHFLRLLKKLHLLGDTLNTGKNVPESLYDELISRVLKEISSYFKHDIEEDQNKIIPLSDGDPPYKFPAICPDYCKYPTEMDRLENLVDTSDGFLMTAFRAFFIEENRRESPPEVSLYERISTIRKTFYPAKQIVDRVLSQMLRDRYRDLGYLVKNILIIDFQMRKHFELLRHLFLFKDDVIFSLYKRLFIQMVDNKKFENDIWLTTQLHDIMIDLYPDFYEKCIVKISDSTQTLDDPLRACEMIDINYVISWPVSLIITDRHLEMYSDLFRLILKVKWALYTLNHLYFNDIEPECGKTQQTKLKTLLLRKLKVFRFHLLNEFSNIQHYILGFVFKKYLKKFEMDFDKAHNLDTLVASHSNFINSVHATAMAFKKLNDKSHGFNLLLYIVKKLHGMWKDVRKINEEELFKYEELFIKCRDALDPVIFPRDLIMLN